VKKLIFAMSATVLLGAGCSAIGTRDMSSGHGMGGMKSEHGMMGSMMMKMDTNGDGMLSKDEFMKGHEAMFDRMKGPNGMISINEMGKMGNGNMMGQRQQMPGGMEPGGK
jgi:Ca2+-binding EF-hand superfamily protein